MKRNSGISVIIPTHNDGELLERCLASVTAQSLAPDEIIVVDDGSTAPASLQGIERSLQSFPEVRLVRQPNSGPSVARDRGVAEAAGTFIAFVDADDELTPDNLMAKRTLFGRSEDAIASFAGIKFIEPDGRTHYSRYRDYLGPLDPDLIGRPDGMPGFLWAYLFRRDAFQAIGGLDARLRIMEDFDALIRLGRIGGTFVGYNEPVYVQNRRLGSLARGSAGRQVHGALRFLAKARRNGYFSGRELLWRYLAIPYGALKIVIRYSLRR